jgi:hypothetical protein
VNKKVLGIAVFLLAVAMLALSISFAFATKPDKFESFTFYGGPYMGAGTPVIEEGDAGESANHFMDWIFVGWRFSWTPTGTQVFAVGSYSGYWVHHGYEAGTPFGTHTAKNTNGVFKMTVTNWNGEEGYLILRAVSNENPSGKSEGKLTVLDGMIGDMKVHGTGTSTEIVPHFAWRYDLTLQFTS